MPTPERPPDAYYLAILDTIRRCLPDGLAVTPYFEATNPALKIATRDEVQRLSSKHIILRHPQSGCELWTDRNGRAYTMTTARREANALIETITRQATAPRTVS